MDAINWSSDPLLGDMIIGGSARGGAVISQLAPIETRMVGTRRGPNAPQVEQGVPLTQASLYQAPYGQMKKFGIM
jgi:hypothetical protein